MKMFHTSDIVSELFLLFQVGSTDGNTTYIEVTHLKKTVTYHFRVTAKNCKGYGTPYAPDEGIVVGKRISTYSFHRISVSIFLL